ncbi:PrgH/EprH family type III secretion apparatus protein [Yersinia enterocolitica]|uniref:PrgH/EprH family type III secretion apparatus protein n=1 Tax=Yersinia enterocolitica TaxID=630 RepID=UPI00398D46B8
MDTKDNTTSVVSKPKVLRVLNGLLNGCEFVIVSERLLVVVGADSGANSLETIAELPDDTLFIPQNENGTNFEILLNKEDENDVRLRELTEDEPKISSISLNSRVQVGNVIFAIGEQDKKWMPDVLGYVIEKTIDESKQSATEKKRNRFYSILAVLIFIIVSSVTYWFYDSMDSHLRRLNKVLVNTKKELILAHGRDNITYVFAENERKAIWANQVIERGDYTGSVRVIFPEKESERIYSWLSNYIPKVKYFRLQLNNTLTPRLLISKQRSNLTTEQIEEIRTQLMSIMPYAKSVEIVEINDTDLISQAEEELGALSLSYKRNQMNDYISYSIEGELNDSELIRLQYFVDGFYHQWGREFIRFNVSLEDNYLKDKSFSYGNYNYVKSGPGQWLFRKE